MFNSSRRLPCLRFSVAFDPRLPSFYNYLIVKGPIFIVGPHRAGSTLWHNLIAMCPGVLRLAEARFMGPPRQRDFRYFLKTQVGDLSHDENVEKMVRLCFSRKAVPGLDGAMWKFTELQTVTDEKLLDVVSRRIKASDRQLGSVARIIVEELTRFAGCERACVKFPVDVRYIRELMRWFPDGKVVHITRDPRGLAISKSNDPSGTAPMVGRHPYLASLIRKAALGLVIFQYRRSARLHRSLQSSPNYQLFRYEDLLADPEATLRTLCEFIDEPFFADLLEPQKGKHEHQPSSLTGKQQKAFEPEAAIRWRKVISRSDNFAIKLCTAGSMQKLGYNPDTHPIFQTHELTPIVHETSMGRRL